MLTMQRAGTRVVFPVRAVKGCQYARKVEAGSETPLLWAGLVGSDELGGQSSEVQL